MVLLVMPQLGQDRPKMPVFLGLSRKSTRRLVFSFRNGTTIALYSVQRIPYTQHPTLWDQI
jgi:hypothetical protein